MRDYSSQDSGEMTMEEILASIRRYVAEDMPAKQSPQPEKVVRLTEEYIDNGEQAAIITPPPAPEHVFAAADSHVVRKPAPVESVASMFQAEESAYRGDKRQDLSRDEATRTAANAFTLNSQADQAGAKSPFDRLRDVMEEQQAAPAPKPQPAAASNGAASSHEALLKAFFTDMATPFIERWLEKNMQHIVEDMVQQEIEKVRRTGRR